MHIRIARSPEEILLCWDVMHELRPHLVKREFVPLVTEMIREGYILAYIIEDGPGGVPVSGTGDAPGGAAAKPGVSRAAAAVGFRYLRFLLHGEHIYIDDLSTLPDHRKKGYAGALLEYVFGLAADRGLKVVALDSGPARHAAHRLYLNRGFALASYHFVRSLEPRTDSPG